MVPSAPMQIDSQHGEAGFMSASPPRDRAVASPREHSSRRMLSPVLVAVVVVVAGMAKVGGTNMYL